MVWYGMLWKSLWCIEQFIMSNYGERILKNRSTFAKVIKHQGASFFGTHCSTVFQKDIKTIRKCMFNLKHSQLKR